MSLYLYYTASMHVIVRSGASSVSLYMIFAQATWKISSIDMTLLLTGESSEQS